MTRYQKAKRLHTWICAGIAMAVYGGFILALVLQTGLQVDTFINATWQSSWRTKC